MKILRIMVLAAAALACLPLPVSAQRGEFLAYFGTYTRQNSKGIYCWRFDAATGKATSLGLVAESSNPAFLAISPDHRFLYAANENNAFGNERTGSISAFAIDAKTGQLKLLNQVSSGGMGPCHVSVDKTGKWVFAANYGGGNVAAFPVQADGSLGKIDALAQHDGSSINPERQQKPAAHSANPSPDGHFVLVADLGIDQVFSYALDTATGMVNTPSSIAKIQPGSGPRHMAFLPNGKYVYLLSELSATVTAFDYDAPRGSLREMQTISTLPADFSGTKGAAEIVIEPAGKFLYASNRGTADTIAVFAIEGRTGKLSAVEYVPTQGKSPRSIAIDPTGNYLFAANQESGNVVLFRIDRKTGKLAPTGDRLEVPWPVCVVFTPAK